MADINNWAGIAIDIDEDLEEELRVVEPPVEPQRGAPTPEESTLFIGLCNCNKFILSQPSTICLHKYLFILNQYIQ